MVRECEVTKSIEEIMSTKFKFKHSLIWLQVLQAVAELVLTDPQP